MTKSIIRLEDLLKWFALGYQVLGQLTAPPCPDCGGRLIFLWCGYFCLNCGGFKDFAKIHQPAV